MCFTDAHAPSLETPRRCLWLVSDSDHTSSDHKRRLARLTNRITQAKSAQGGANHGGEHYSQAQLAWRMVIELVSGLGIGLGIGIGLDRLFGTTPVLLVVFVLLGFAAGVKVMMRSAQEVQQQQQGWERHEGQEAQEGQEGREGQSNGKPH